MIDLLGDVFIHNSARSRLSPQMAKPCRERIDSSQHKILSPDDKIYFTNLYFDYTWMIDSIRRDIFILQKIICSSYFGIGHIDNTSTEKGKKMHCKIYMTKLN